MIKNLLSSLNTIFRILKNIITRPFTNLYAKIRTLLTGHSLVTAAPGVVKKLPKVLKAKPEKRGDYFDWGVIYVAKSLVVILAIVIIALPLLYIFLLHPLLTSWFWVKDFYTGDSDLETYSGKVRVYYEESFDTLEFEGRLDNGKAKEHGEEHYENGGIKYVGDYVDGLYEGEGILYYEDGSVCYSGSFAAGVYEGAGKYTDENGDVYAGTFTGGVITGSGTLTKSGKLYYSGYFADGVISGDGKIYYADGGVKLAGTFADGVVNGSAMEYYEDGTLKYSGMFSAGLYSGEGVLYFESGKKQYSGAFELGVYSGEGTLYSEDGSKLYTGEFEEGIYSGTGKLYNPDGSVISGGFSGGEVTGAAEEAFPSGRKYSGCFEDGIMNGSGVFTDVTETFKYSGNFVDGDFDYSEFIGADPETVKEKLAALTSEVADDCFYLVDKSFGIAMKCSFASSGTAAAVTEVYTRPITGLAPEIASEADITAPNAGSVAKSGDVMSAWAAEMFSIDAADAVCYAAYYDKVTVYYWVKDGVLVLKSAAAAENGGADSAQDSQDEGGSGGDTDVSMEEITELFGELGLDPEDFYGLGIFGDEEEQENTASITSASSAAPDSDIVTELSALNAQALTAAESYSPEQGTTAEAPDTAEASESPKTTEAADTAEAAADTAEAAESSEAASEEAAPEMSEIYQSRLTLAGEYLTAAESSESELSGKLADYDVYLKKLKVLVGRYKTRKAEYDGLTEKFLIGECSEDDLNAAKDEVSAAVLEIRSLLFDISAAKTDIEKSLGETLTASYDFDGAYLITNPLELDYTALADYSVPSSIYVPTGAEATEYEPKDCSADYNTAVQSYYTLASALKDYISAAKAESAGADSLKLGTITEDEYTALCEAKEDAFLAAAEAKRDFSKALAALDAASGGGITLAYTKSESVTETLRSTVPAEQRGEGLWTVTSGADGARLCVSSFPAGTYAAEGDDAVYGFKVSYNGTAIGESENGEPCRLSAIEYAQGENYADVVFYKDGKAIGSYKIDIFAPYGEFIG